MTALNKNRYSTQRAGVQHEDPVAAGAHIYNGAIVVIDADGNAAPGTEATGLKSRGAATREVDNTGGNAGDKSAETEVGVFLMENDGSVDRTHIGSTAYIVDDQTVAAGDNSGARSPAGLIDDVTDDGVFVHLGE